YGKKSYEELEYRQKTATAPDVVAYLSEMFGVEGYDMEKSLKILAVRFAMNSNSYQQYIATTIASNVSRKTVAVILENQDELAGVEVAEGTIRKYNDSVYFSQILGYTGKISQDELESYSAKNPEYDMTDTVGKAGIEASMEEHLQGRKGSEILYVNNLGKVIETMGRTEPAAGNDVYLSIDKDLQIACYDILEQKLSSILLAKIKDIKEYNAENSSDIVIPIYDVYIACFANNIIDRDHLASPDASNTEKEIYQKYRTMLSEALTSLEEELVTVHTPYDQLQKEYQAYETRAVQLLYSDGILMSSSVDRDDPVYIAWTTDETISMYEFLNYAITMGWVDVTRLDIDEKYTDSEAVYRKLVDKLIEELRTDDGFSTVVYRYMIRNDVIEGWQVCRVLIDQGAVGVERAELSRFEHGQESAYDFMRNRIEQLDITPGQLALDPHSGSIVVTDTSTGKVKALVSYPSYDNNRMANGVDADYYAALRIDLSSPQLNYATMQKTAPGSTFKMVSATAGLKEGVIDPGSGIVCHGIFDKTDRAARCWIYPGAHGSLNVTGGIRNSCNCFFYEVGYRLSLVGGVNYKSDVGLQTLAKYARMYGLGEPSGVEIDESDPEISDIDSVRSAIGQGSHNYTTVQLSKYVTAVANRGTCYDLTLISKVSEASGKTVYNKETSVYNQIDMDPSCWTAIQSGMRGVVENKAYFSDLGVSVAGKTGTAQESSSRPNHALFVSYAPYENPEVSVSVRIANGYTSDYAAQTAREVYRYYYGLAGAGEILKDVSDELEEGVINGD
ncbi:MAG: penicillin-binding protein, partial [Lachnospiraceae bacterium]|nr:penicillin-binding protein [Lachnospiraceae bacterium]